MISENNLGSVSHAGGIPIDQGCATSDVGSTSPVLSLDIFFGQAELDISPAGSTFSTTLEHEASATASEPPPGSLSQPVLTSAMATELPKVILLNDVSDMLESTDLPLERSRGSDLPVGGQSQPGTLHSDGP